MTYQERICPETWEVNVVKSGDPSIKRSAEESQRFHKMMMEKYRLAAIRMDKEGAVAKEVSGDK